MTSLPVEGCTCRHEEKPLGMLHGVNMGRGVVRTGTTKNCPVHDTCQGYTKAHRAKRPEWSRPWCPIHGTRDCPPPAVRENEEGS